MRLRIQDPRTADWSGGPDEPPIWGWAGIFLAFLLLAFFYGNVTQLTDAPDNVFHVEYVRHVFQGQLIPVYDHPASYNSLPHPALYYTLAGKFVAFLNLFVDGTLRDLVRVFDLILGLFTVWAFYRIAGALIRDPVTAFCAALAAIAVPQFAYNYIGPNSDHLGNLFVALTALFALRYLLFGKTGWLAATCCIAVLTPMAKLPQSIPALFMAGCCGLHFLSANRSIAALRPHLKYAVPVLIAAGVMAAYLAFMLARYGAFYPSPSTVVEWFNRASPGILDNPRQALVPYFLDYMERLMTVAGGPAGHSRLVAFDRQWNLISVAVLVSLFSPLLYLAWRPVDRPRLWFSVFVVSAVVLTFATAFVALYRFHLEVGYGGGVQFRYLHTIGAIGLIVLFGGVSGLVRNRSVPRAAAVLFAVLAVTSVPLRVAEESRPQLRNFENLIPSAFTAADGAPGLDLPFVYDEADSGDLHHAFRAGRYFVLRGWAFDPETRGPARAVIVTADGAVRAVMMPQVPRPGIRAVTGSTNERDVLYGFDIRLPAEGIDWSDVRIYSLSPGGVLHPIEAQVVDEFRAAYPNDMQ